MTRNIRGSRSRQKKNDTGAVQTRNPPPAVTPLNSSTEPRIRAVIDKVFPFAQLAEARERMEGNQQTGKIVVTMEGSQR